MHIKTKKRLSNILCLYIPMIIVMVVVLIPFLWALSTSFKTQQEFMSPVIKYLPESFNFDNYISVWTGSRFSNYFVNSLVVSLVSVVFTVIFCICNACALSRYNFKGKQVFTMVLLGTQMMPVILFIIPLFMVFKTLDLIDNPIGLIIFNIVLQTPFNTLLMRGFVNNIPKEIDEAAMVDGAGKITIMFKILAPMLKPGIVAVAAFAFIGCWNEFLVSFSFMQTADNFTIPVGLKYMIGEYSVDYPSLAAGSIIALIPPVALFALIQKNLISGLGAGAVKG